MSRGWFAIGVWHAKTEANIGTLFRSAHALGAAYVFTVGRRYSRQVTDTVNAAAQMPLFHFDSVDAVRRWSPLGAPLVGVELDVRAQPLTTFCHPNRAVYLLGAEDHGLNEEERRACHFLVQLPGSQCLNVAAAGTVVLYDRFAKSERRASWGEAAQ